MLGNEEEDMKKINKGTKIILIIIAIVFFIINGIGLYAGNLFYNKVCNMYFDKAQSSYEAFKNTFNYERFAKLNKEEVSIRSNFGYKLSGTYIMNPQYTEDTVVIVHGITGSRWESMKYADIYLDLGFNVLVYDSRYHGKSGGNNISLGYFEKYDLDNCINWVKDRNPNGIIGVHGESLGAATALLQSAMNENKKTVLFYIVDCPFSDLPKLFEIKSKDELKGYSYLASKAIVFYSSMVALYKSGFSLYSISPIKAISNVKTPIMFVHGADDELIPPNMSMDLYLEKSGPKYLYIAPNAGHTQSYSHNKEEYFNKVQWFLNYNNILKLKRKENQIINKNIMQY